MAKFTLLELHFDDSTLTANAPYSRGEKEISAGDEPVDETETDGSNTGAVFAALIGLVFLATIAYVVKTRVLGGDDEALESGDDELVELDDIDA